MYFKHTGNQISLTTPIFFFCYIFDYGKDKVKIDLNPPLRKDIKDSDNLELSEAEISLCSCAISLYWPILAVRELCLDVSIQACGMRVTT